MSNERRKAKQDEDTAYCPNCYHAYSVEDDDDVYLYVEEDDPLYTEDNYGVLCRECHPDFSASE